MKQTKDLWVVAEHKDGELQEVTLEMLGDARRLADKIGSSVCAVLMGHRLTGMVDPLVHYGAERVFIQEHPLLAHYSNDAFTAVLTDLIQEHAPTLVLIGATANGKDLAPRVAARLKVGLATNCMMIKSNNSGELQMTRLTYGSQFQQTIACSSDGTQMATIIPGVIGVGRSDKNRQAEITYTEVKLDSNMIRTRTLDFIKPDPKDIELNEADIIVSGGRGVGGSGKWHLIEEMANALGASVGGSRVAMDLNSIPRKRLVGLSGNSVAPKLYLAAGISGASHHLGGIRGAKLIIAINTDPTAPIFQVADLKVVADLHQVIPAMIKYLRQRTNEE